MGVALEVTLITGQKRILAHDVDHRVVEAAARAFHQRVAPFAGDWLITTDGTTIARAHIVEVALIDKDYMGRPV